MGHFHHPFTMVEREWFILFGPGRVFLTFMGLAGVVADELECREGVRSKWKRPDPCGAGRNQRFWGEGDGRRASLPKQQENQCQHQWHGVEDQAGDRESGDRLMAALRE